MDQYEFDPTDDIRTPTAGIQIKTPKDIHESLAAMPDFASIINLSSYDRDMNQKIPDSQENGLCDNNPMSRTLPKNGQNINEDIPQSFMMKIPYFAYKPEKNKKCQVCGKHARTPSDLLRHMRVHTGERPFPCVACNKTFKCKRSQLTHQYLSHGIKDGLSEHRLNVLDHRKTKRNPPKPKENYLTQMPSLIMDNINTFMLKNNHTNIQPEPIPQPVIDQDEDTEIMAEEEISCSNDGPVSFVGLFNSQTENNMASLTDESQQMNLENNNKTDFHTVQTVDSSPFIKQESDMQDEKESNINNAITSESNIIELLKRKKNKSKKVPILRIKTHKCTHCRRQFRSIYTLRYHLRSMHDEKVYLSPALETRLKKRRWIPPHVRLQKSKISSSHGVSKRDLTKEKDSNAKANYSLLPTYPNEEIEQKFFAHAAQSFNESLVQQNKCGEAVDLHINKNNTFEIKKEKLDTYEEEINNNISLNYNDKIEKSFRNVLNMNEKEIKQLNYFASTQPNSTTINTSNAFTLNTNTTANNANPFVLPPHIFFPSTPAAEEGLMNEKPISWESLQVTAESVLISKLEALHPGTQQKYVLYKCGLCGKAFASLRVICGHLALHNNSAKEKDCEKCGASFKWRTELDSHLECHQVSDRKFMTSSPYLPSYYVNPFSIPVVTPNEQNVLSTTRLLPYPFFPMPQQIPPLMQPGFFPFFATAALQPQMQPGSNSNEEVMHNTQQTTTENGHPTENYDEKNSAQNCTFQCKMCPKTFDRIFSLQRHERIHSGVKACFCKICGRGFSELRNLRHHIMRFHAESAQKEPLPYRRRPNRMRNISSSRKLVSFLKKTAVRILNSVGQNKLDPPTPEEIQNAVKLENEPAQDHNVASEPQNLSTTVTTNNSENITEKHATATMPKLIDATSHIAELSPTHDLNEVPPPKLSPGVSNEVKETNTMKDTSSNANGAVEVLQDPKRSLLGNRRKGRPFKLSSASNQTINLGVDEMLFPLHDSNFFGKHAAAITESSLLQATEFLNGCLKQEIAFPQLNFFNMNNQEPPAPPQPTNVNIPETSTNVNVQEPPANVNAQEASPIMNIQEQSTNEPIDMTNPIVKEKANTPPKQEPESQEIKQKNTTVPTENNTGLNVYNEVQQTSTNVKLPESFESRCLFPCSYCHKSFSSIADINRHMSFHADIRPFKCPYCNYCSRTNSQLKVHMMRHEGIKHYMCQVCNYNGVTQSDLNRHLKTRTHLLRSRNVCACCGTGFHTRSLSDEHYKSCHLSANKNNQDQNSKNPQDSTPALNKPPVPNNRNRVTRLKQFRTPDEKIKNEFYQKLCDMNNLGVSFGEFLQQSATAAMTIEK